MARARKKESADTRISGMAEMREMYIRKRGEQEKESDRLTKELLGSLDPKDSDKLKRLLDSVKEVSNTRHVVDVPLDEVEDEFAFGLCSIIRCKKCFIWKSGNYRAVVYPSYDIGLTNGGGALYGTLDELCALAEKDRRHLLTDNDKEERDVLQMLVTMAFTLPVMMFSDTSFAVDVYKYVMDRWKTSLEQALERIKEETEEDIAKNQQYEDMMTENESVSAELDKAKD